MLVMSLLSALCLILVLIAFGCYICRVKGLIWKWLHLLLLSEAERNEILQRSRYSTLNKAADDKFARILNNLPPKN